MPHYQHTFAEVSNQPLKLFSSQKVFSQDMSPASLPLRSRLLASRTDGIRRPLSRRTFLSRSCFHSAAASRVQLFVTSKTTSTPIAPL